MNESKKRFVDQLLAADPPSADARQRYEKEMRDMFEKTLTRGERRGYLFGAVLMGLLGLAHSLLGLGILVSPTGPTTSRLPPEPAFLLLATCILATGIALLNVAGILFQGYWKGVVSRRRSSTWAAGAGVAYLGLLGVLSLLMGECTPEMLDYGVRVVGLVLLVYAAVSWMRHRVAQAELRTTEKLLEIELRIAEIGEALQARPKPADPASAQQPPLV
jgi:hypothetical protein